MKSEQKNYTLPIIVMFALFFMIAFVTGLQNPMGVIVKNQFEASNFMSQLGNAANFIAYAFMGIPAGMLLRKIGYRKTAIAAVTVGFIGVGVQYIAGGMESFGVYLAGAFIAGFSMCMLNTVVNPMLNTLGGGGNKGNRLLQFGGTANSLAATIVPVLVGYLMGSNQNLWTISKVNPVLYLAMGIFALAFIVLAYVKIPEPEQEKVVAEKNDKHSAMSFRHFKLGVLAIFIYVGVEVGIPNVANLYMTTPTVDAARATVERYEQQQSRGAEYLKELNAADEIGKATEGYQFKVVSKEDYDKAQSVIDGKIKQGRGMAAGVAGALVGLYWLLMLCGRLLGGVIGGRVSSKKMLMCVSSVAAILVIGAIAAKDTVVTLPEFISNYLTSDSKTVVVPEAEAIALAAEEKFSLPAVQSAGTDLTDGTLTVGEDLLLEETVSAPEQSADTATAGPEGVQLPLSIVLLVLCGLCTSVMWGGIFNLAVDGLGKYTSMASGIFMMMVCGGGILPLIQSYIADVSGYMTSYWLIFGCLCYLLFYALKGSKNVNTDIKTE